MCLRRSQCCHVWSGLWWFSPLVIVVPVIPVVVSVMVVIVTCFFVVLAVIVVYVLVFVFFIVRSVYSFPFSSVPTVIRVVRSGSAV